MASAFSARGAAFVLRSPPAGTRGLLPGPQGCRL